MRRDVLSLVALLAIVAGAGAARGAAPITHGRYEGKWLALTISGDGRSLSSDDGDILSSALRFPSCGGHGRSTTTLADSTHVDPLLIDARGRFKLDETKRLSRTLARHITLVGSFGTPTLATGTLRVKTLRRGATRCDTQAMPFTVRFTGERFSSTGSCGGTGVRVLARDGADTIESEPFHDGGYGWDWPFANPPARLYRVAVLCDAASGRRRLVEASAASGDPDGGDGALITQGWVLGDEYYANVNNVCCENGVITLDVTRRSDLKDVNSVLCGQYEDYNPCNGRWYMTATGTLCWADKPDLEPASRVVVQRPGRQPQIIDTDVVIDSLKLSGSTLTWTKTDGEQRSAEVP